MAASESKTAGLAIALLLTNNAFALGLGEASGRAILGQPLRLEIPILGGDGTAPLKSCFRLHAPRAEVGNDFAARNARFEVAGTKLVVTTAAAVVEPVIGFAVEASCAGVSRDYVLLVGLPAAPAPTPVVETPRAAAPAVSAPAAPAPAAPAPSEKTPVAPQDVLRISAPVTIEALAQQKYPLQPKAREKFARMMTEANPGLVSPGTPIAAGTELKLPPGLPQKRVGPYRGETKAPAPKKATVEETLPESPVASAPAAKATPKAGSKDRLVLGRAPKESSEAKLLAEAERLAGILVEQTRAQEDMTASLSKMEADYAELRKQFVEMQTKLARIEAERVAERQAAAEAAKTQQLVELLAAVLGGGAVGGIGLHLFQRHRSKKRGDDEIDGFGAADALAPVAAASAPWSGKPAVPPWMMGKAKAANEIGAVEAKASPAALVAAVVGASSVDAAEVEAIETNAAEAPSQAEVGDSDLLMASQIVGRNPPPPSDESASGVREEIPSTVVADESLALPEVEEEAPVVLEPLDFSSVAITAEEAALVPSVATQEQPAAKQEEARAQETLTLDFPEIKLPGTE